MDYPTDRQTNISANNVYGFAENVFSIISFLFINILVEILHKQLQTLVYWIIVSYAQLTSFHHKLIDSGIKLVSFNENKCQVKDVYLSFCASFLKVWILKTPPKIDVVFHKMWLGMVHGAI